MKRYLRYLRIALLVGLVGVLLGVSAIVGSYYYLKPDLPDIETLRDIRFQVPMRVYSRDGKLIAEYGQKRRIPLTYEQLPESMVQAILAAEDDRFFEHPGVDYHGLLRASLQLLLTGEKGQGGSTITMQVARNFLLTREKTYTRKLKEIFLSLEMERILSKEDILALYLNKIFLGHRAYGVGAAAEVYYGKPLGQLNLSQLAMIAGLPKAPSSYNPIANPERALLRRNYVLRRMMELGHIDTGTFQAATAAPVTASLHRVDGEAEAPYVAEMIRNEMVLRYGEEEAYTTGYRVIASIDSREQAAADAALRKALLDYTHRHGYRGAESHVELPEESDESHWSEALAQSYAIGGLEPALVVALGEDNALCYLRDGEMVWLQLTDLGWAKPRIDENRMGAAPKRMDELLTVGDHIRLRRDEQGQWQLSQVPEVAGALVSLDPRDGRLLALSGGFDFRHSKFNRVIQAQRQPGSNFKPFIYSAALDKGYTTASIINDAPVVFDDSKLEDEWRPENYSGRIYGPTRLREALVKSRNLVSIRVLQAIGLRHAIDYLDRFGFDRERLPRDLSLALGSATVTPWELVSGYASFANGGHHIEPWFIERIENAEGEVVWHSDPLVVCDELCQEEQMALALAHEQEKEQAVLEGEDPNSAAVAAPEAGAEIMDAGAGAAEAEAEVLPALIRQAPRILEPRNVYLTTSMMRDVVQRGTGQRAKRELRRNDLAGKTGTTNEQRDAWFSGFNHAVVTTAWVGFNTPRPLGNRETGARAALPMWIDYMRVALDGVPELPSEPPEGLVSVRIDPNTGRFAGADNPDAIFELFRAENVPQQQEQEGNESGQGDNITEQLF